MAGGRSVGSVDLETYVRMAKSVFEIGGQTACRQRRSDDGTRVLFLRRVLCIHLGHACEVGFEIGSYVVATRDGQPVVFRSAKCKQTPNWKVLGAGTLVRLD